MRALAAIGLLAALGLLAGCAARGAWSLAQGQNPQSFKRTVTLQIEGRLLLFLPAGFQMHGKTRYPLLIFLHGSGEVGNDLEKLKVYGPPKIVGSRPDFPFIVASPQSPQNAIRGFDPLMLSAMLDELIERLPIDTDRVYVTGLSMGGIWSYGWASMHPERFAAIVPISGAWDPADACMLKDVPIWAFHGAKDNVVPIARDQAMADAVRACGGDIRFTVYPDTGHDAWTAAYGNPELFTWLLMHRRKSSTR
ncbi:MAG: prolyl oligopeptidase family serine peptidase [Steroidobacteraceae bacterium]